MGVTGVALKSGPVRAGGRVSNLRFAFREVKVAGPGGGGGATCPLTATCWPRFTCSCSCTAASLVLRHDGMQNTLASCLQELPAGLRVGCFCGVSCYAVLWGGCMRLLACVSGTAMVLACRSVVQMASTPTHCALCSCYAMSQQYQGCPASCGANY
jgi:hypothetical protein